MFVFQQQKDIVKEENRSVPLPTNLKEEFNKILGKFNSNFDKNQTSVFESKLNFYLKEYTKAHNHARNIVYGNYSNEEKKSALQARDNLYKQIEKFTSSLNSWLSVLEKVNNDQGKYETKEYWLVSNQLVSGITRDGINLKPCRYTPARESNDVNNQFKQAIEGIAKIDPKSAKILEGQYPNLKNDDDKKEYINSIYVLSSCRRDSIEDITKPLATKNFVHPSELSTYITNSVHSANKKIIDFASKQNKKKEERDMSLADNNIKDSAIKDFNAAITEDKKIAFLIVEDALNRLKLPETKKALLSDTLDTLKKKDMPKEIAEQLKQLYVKSGLPKQGIV